MEVLLLSQLKIGDIAIIVDISPSPIVARLNELGVVVGEVIEVKERSIFYSPIIIKVCGYELCIGKKYTTLITVKRLKGIK